MKWLRNQKIVAVQRALDRIGIRNAHSEEGQSLVMVALSLTLLMGFLAFATDVGVMLRQRRMAQTVADSAAIAAAFESLYEGTPGTVTTGMYDAALRDATLNGFVPGASNGSTNSTTGVTLNVTVTPNISVAGYNSAGNVQATVALNAFPIFMNFFGFKPLTVGASAIAANTLTADGCFYVNNGGGYANPAVKMGGSSVIFGQNCGVTINGNATLTGNADITAKFVAATGTITLGGSGSITASESQGTGAPTPDPLFKLQETANKPTVSGGTCTAPAGSGMSCRYNYQGGNLSGALPSNTLFVFDNNVTARCGNGGGNPCVEINGSLTGSGVTLYLMNNLPLDFDHNGAATLTPPGYGSSCVGSANPLCGILIDAPTDGSASQGTYTCSSGLGNNAGNPGELYFDFGSSTTVINGIIYAPYMQVFVQDQGASTTINSSLVVGNVCSQAATLTVNAYSGPQSPLTKIGLVY